MASVKKSEAPTGGFERAKVVFTLSKPMVIYNMNCPCVFFTVDSFLAVEAPMTAPTPPVKTPPTTALFIAPLDFVSITVLLPYSSIL